MRKWIIVGVVLLLLCVAGVVAVLNVNSYIARNKDYLISQAEQALGRKVSVDEVEISLWNGIGFRLTNFAMSDDPAFSSAEFVRAKDLQVNLKFLPLLRRDVRVKKLILHNPAISIIRNAKGDFNFSTIAKTEKEKKEDGAKKQKKEAAPKEKEAPSTFFVSLVDISAGDVSYRDQKDGTNLQLRQINLEVEDLDFDRPFTVNLAAALFAAKQNLKIKTVVVPLSRDTAYRDVPFVSQSKVELVYVSHME